MDAQVDFLQNEIAHLKAEVEALRAELDELKDDIRVRSEIDNG